MRGRSAEIEDPGAYGWEVVWEALKTEPPADKPSTITQELGLDRELELRTGGEMGGTEFSGSRNGREVALRLGVVPSALRGRAFNEVQASGAVTPFRISSEKGRLVAEAGAPPEVEGVLAALDPASGVWKQVEVEGGPAGILARRPPKAHPQGYVYDLWLVERLAGALGS
jgi:hypothetical protein